MRATEALSRSVLFITLDSCRFDTFESANIPNMKAVGALHKAQSPSHFTFGSHAAMFVGFTPGVAGLRTPYVNPKYGRIFRLAGGGSKGPGDVAFSLEGENIILGFKNVGYRAIGSGAVAWFDPETETGRVLGKDFDDFFYSGNVHSLERQLEWLWKRIEAHSEQPVFVFLNVGETHVPYYFEGAPWPPKDNRCRPFLQGNDAEACRQRQKACVEFVDSKLAPLLELFAAGTTLICSDHGDCWGEDGLWEHGFHHEAVLTVPLVFRLRPQSRSLLNPRRRTWLR